jgi:hypothetical protein
MPKYAYSFSAPKYIQHTILDENGRVYGTIRVKPSGILWKPKGAKNWYSVGLEDFVAWIKNSRGPAVRAKR